MKGKLLGLVLLCAAQLAAVQITDGEAEFGGLIASRFSLVGPNFTVMGSLDMSHIPALCAEGCAPGHSFTFDRVWSGDGVDGGPGTVDGVFYPLLIYEYPEEVGSGFWFQGPDFLITDSLVYSARFTLVGGLYAVPRPSGTFPPESCVICTIVITDEDVDVRPIPIHGAGRVTLTLRETGPPHPGRSPLILDTLVYEFEAIPEPATIWLVAVPVAALISKRALASISAHLRRIRQDVRARASMPLSPRRMR
jgi:hypothetical protein